MASEKPVTTRKKNQMVCDRMFCRAAICRRSVVVRLSGIGKWVSRAVIPISTAIRMMISR